MERFFETANTEMFHQMLGNTKAMKNPRQVTKAVNPETTAVWTLESLFDAVSSFCYEYYNNHEHDTFGCAPNKRFRDGIQRHGERLGRAREYDDSFIKLTFPTTRFGELTVGRTGIRMFGGFSFWAKGMEKVRGEKVPVCYDPDDVSKVYVFLNKEWVWARAGSHHVLEKLSRRALSIAAKELFAEQSRKGEAQQISEATMGKFLQSNLGQESLARQKQIDEQFRKIQGQAGGGETSEPATEAGSEGKPNTSSDLKPPVQLRTMAIPRSAAK